jgi:hypothetical protein
MGWFWKGLMYVILILLLVRCDTSASLFEASSNRIKVMFPAFLETPLVWAEFQVGSPMRWDTINPFSEDYKWQLRTFSD